MDGAHTHGHGPTGLGELVVLALGVVLAADILARVLTLLLVVLAVGGGKTYTAPSGKVFRPSMFLTLTCPSYGRVTEDGIPVDSSSYDYAQAARHALHFAALFDRFTQNLRRVLGYDVQYFATIEPQRRLAPHVHIAMRGTISRAELRQIIAATYHQVW